MSKILARIDSDLQELIPKYLENRSMDIEAIEEGLRMADYNLIRRLAHRMKGSGGGYGFEGITVIGAAMEQAALKNDADEIVRQVQALKDYLNRVEIIYV